MKKLSSHLKVTALFAVACFLMVPATSAAYEYRELGTVEFGPGVQTEVFNLGANARTMSFTTGSDLKSLIVSVQNGSERGKDRVSSAVVSVNGEEIFTQKHFSQNVSSLTRTIEVNDPWMSEVVMTVKVNSHKNAHLFVTLTGVYENSVPQIPWFLDTDVPPNYIGGPIVGMGTFDTQPPPDPRGIWVLVGGDIR